MIKKIDFLQFNIKTNMNQDPTESWMCNQCGTERPMSYFTKDGRTATGFANNCNICKGQDNISTQLLRECTKCEVKKPNSEFDKNIKYRDGYSGKCIPCLRLTSPLTDNLRCSWCGLIKAFDDFYKANTVRGYRYKCKTCEAHIKTTNESITLQCHGCNKIKLCVEFGKTKHKWGFKENCIKCEQDTPSVDIEEDSNILPNIDGKDQDSNIDGKDQDPKIDLDFDLLCSNVNQVLDESLTVPEIPSSFRCTRCNFVETPNDAVSHNNLCRMCVVIVKKLENLQISQPDQ
jgi:hypothetical protein